MATVTQNMSPMTSTEHMPADATQFSSQETLIQGPFIPQNTVSSQQQSSSSSISPQNPETQPTNQRTWTCRGNSEQSDRLSTPPNSRPRQPQPSANSDADPRAKGDDPWANAKFLNPNPDSRRQPAWYETLGNPPPEDPNQHPPNFYNSTGPTLETRPGQASGRDGEAFSYAGSGNRVGQPMQPDENIWQRNSPQRIWEESYGAGDRSQQPMVMVFLCFP